MELRDALLKEYMASVERVVGKRTPGEIAFDDTVLAGLGMGLPLKMALHNAAQRYPAEALTWNEETAADLASHYDYLKKHQELMKRVAMSRQK